MSLSNEGRIELILGPMFSGKTQELVRRIRRWVAARKSCFVIKYAKDTRYSVDKVSTHNKETYDAISLNKLSDLQPQLIKGVQVLGIDEGNFFGDELKDFCEKYANMGVIVIVAALDATYEREPFSNVVALVPVSESVVKLNAVCVTCGRDAAYSERREYDHNLEVIGGQDKYKAACRQCFRIPNKQDDTVYILKRKIAQPVYNCPFIDNVNQPNKKTKSP